MRLGVAIKGEPDGGNSPHAASGASPAIADDEARLLASQIGRAHV